MTAILLLLMMMIMIIIETQPVRKLFTEPCPKQIIALDADVPLNPQTNTETNKPIKSLMNPIIIVISLNSDFIYTLLPQAASFLLMIYG
jgi:hypothetical protein